LGQRNLDFIGDAEAAMLASTFDARGHQNIMHQPL
jgi:hypothetical protein